MLKKSKAWLVTNYAVMFATIFVAMLLDRLISSWISLGISTAVCVTLVTFSFCFVYNRWDMGILAGTFFGLASWIKAFLFGEVFTVNPLVPIPARVAAGLVAFAVYKLVVMLTSKMKSRYARQTLSISLGTFFGLAVNTLLFLTALNLYKDFLGEEYGSIFEVIKAVLYVNILPEYLISILFVPHIVIGVRRGMRLGIEANFGKTSQSAVEISSKEV